MLDEGLSPQSVGVCYDFLIPCEKIKTGFGTCVEPNFHVDGDTVVRYSDWGLENILIYGFDAVLLKTVAHFPTE